MQHRSSVPWMFIAHEGRKAPSRTFGEIFGDCLPSTVANTGAETIPKLADRLCRYWVRAQVERSQAGKRFRLQDRVRPVGFDAVAPQDRFAQRCQVRGRGGWGGGPPAAGGSGGAAGGQSSAHVRAVTGRCQPPGRDNRSSPWHPSGPFFGKFSRASAIHDTMRREPAYASVFRTRRSVMTGPARSSRCEEFAGSRRSSPVALAPPRPACRPVRPAGPLTFSDGELSGRRRFA